MNGSSAETQEIYNMNYFERCKKRIEDAKKIDFNCTQTLSTIIKHTVDEELVLRKFTHSELNVSYTIMFKDVKVPISENEISYLFELSEKKLNELISIEHQNVLKEL